MKYDYDSVLNVIHHLKVECLPTVIYSVGRPEIGKNRLLKVILPASRFQHYVVRMPPACASSPKRGSTFESPLLKTKEGAGERNVYMTVAMFLTMV